MPLQLYDKDKILDACFEVFAIHGYANTSTTMLAEAAGISKALIFHHFNNKKDLYLSVLDRCIEKGRIEMGFDTLLENQDFFEAKEKFSIIKVNYYKKNPKLMKVMMEAFYETPVELKTEIQNKYGMLLDGNEKAWKKLFEKVDLRENVNREQAFRLVMLTLDYFDNKYLADLENNNDFEEVYLNEFLSERNSFLSMIRFGIER
ncbi:TetR/AcrR family transcriptional regulator [Sedimentibacter hydroxybenzoicus DSM 7310]|uniref:TetR/AcrR family transcriptional regulator n=1 Tax=Sedimentibacter hydroxybenzoicus DSM 7310 TaxID=1123245 RepID=A0A974BL58_SEDHY|nr:TetR/AcrR family transcriptional regulator [Sedimentibacter hydroxybenzoicus]NYB75229.1 TetR/AcrR family transcriptional regulator [Sedimentibacter hydroxybenzoicus DSM 7310]